MYISGGGKVPIVLHGNSPIGDRGERVFSWMEDIPVNNLAHIFSLKIKEGKQPRLPESLRNETKAAYDANFG